MGRVVSHDFWYRPNVAGHLARFDLPAVLGMIAAEPGWSQDELAQLLNYSRPTLNKIVNGVRPLRLDEALQLVRVLAIPPHLIGVSGNPEEVSPANRRQFGQLVAAGTVAAALPSSSAAKDPMVERIKATTQEFAALERERGGNPLCKTLIRHVSTWAPEVREVGNPALVSAFGELCGLTGHAHYDAQQYRLANHYYSVGLQAAHESQDSALTGQIRALMSMQATWLDRAREGASHCTAALETISRLPTIEQAMLMGRQARAEALRGERDRVHRLIDRGRELVALGGSVQPVIAYWSETEMYGNAGIAYKELGEYALAEQNLRAAIAAAGEADSRDATLYLGMLSRLLLKLKRYEEAAQVVDRIMAAPVMSSRTEKQLTLFLAKTRSLDGRSLLEVRQRIRSRLDI